MHYIRQFLRLCAATQAVIGVVQQELDKFDAVCMATALHTLASMRASAQQYAALFERPEVLRLMHVIGERCQSLNPSEQQTLLICLVKYVSVAQLHYPRMGTHCCMLWLARAPD